MAILILFALGIGNVAMHKAVLESGHPPDDWDQLLAEARKESQRMRESLARAAAAQ